MTLRSKLMASRSVRAPLGHRLTSVTWQYQRDMHPSPMIDYTSSTTTKTFIKHNCINAWYLVPVFRVRSRAPPLLLLSASRGYSFGSCMDVIMQPCEVIGLTIRRVTYFIIRLLAAVFQRPAKPSSTHSLEQLLDSIVVDLTPILSVRPIQQYDYLYVFFARMTSMTTWIKLWYFTTSFPSFKRQLLTY